MYESSGRATLSFSPALMSSGTWCTYHITASWQWPSRCSRASRGSLAARAFSSSHSRAMAWTSRRSLRLSPAPWYTVSSCGSRSRSSSTCSCWSSSTVQLSHSRLRGACLRSQRFRVSDMDVKLLPRYWGRGTLVRARCRSAWQALALPAGCSASSSRPGSGPAAPFFSGKPSLPHLMRNVEPPGMACKRKRLRSEGAPPGAVQTVCVMPRGRWLMIHMLAPWW
mmetsp:Transcript_56351/g.180922  ORF Transcript_56351/g.180922 Transcript_56351/m.180922 type:complete len:224 (+) Transcript_56351:186-857(+)